eukprot:6198161-Pleurochrysis_carterae.AAC.1
MRDAPESRARQQPFVRGQTCFVKAARGCVWNLRGPAIMPLNFTSGPASPLNVPYIEASLPEWPDARVLGCLSTHEVRFEVDLSLQIVPFSHFISFPDGLSSLQKEV